MEDKLPENLTIDIFSRLPIKSIISCKCVCKKWQSLVADPYFVDLHLARSREEALMILECPDLRSPNVNPKTFLKWLEIDEHEHLDTIKSLNLKHCEPPLIAAFSSLLVPIGSVNGLVSYYWDKNGSVYIFNPLLEEYMTLPPPPPGGSLITLGYGFGVSTATGEYKVIRIDSRRVSIYDPSETVVWAVGIQVYTLGTDQWRSLRQTTPKKNLDLGGLEGLGVYLDSHLYWIAVHAQIYDFDLSSETSELFPAPGENEDSNRMLGVLKGRLSCICWCSSVGGMEVWVMKEESANWYKEINVIRPFSELSPWRPLCLIDGLEHGTSGALLVYVQVAEAEAEKLVAYYLNTKKIVSETPILWSNCSSITTYRPSFVKLDIFGSQRVRAMYNHSPQLTGA